MRDPFGLEKEILAAIPPQVRDPATAFRKIEERLLYSFRQQFLTGGHGHWLQPQRSTHKLMMGSGALYESATTHSDDRSAQLNWGSGLPYARIHQTGGVTHPNVTESSRKFMWRKFYETGDERYKWAALTKKTQFTVSIPARPVVVTAEDIEFIAATLGTRDFKITTNFGASILTT